MRVFFGIAVGVMHTVHNGIRSWIEKRGTLSNKREQVKETIPESVHGEHLMGCITMQEKCLTEE